MSGQDQTTANKPTEPLLCKMGCGFFGNGATGGCCSKCWREQMKKQGVDPAPAVAAPASSSSSVAAPRTTPVRPEPEPMDVEPVASSTAAPRTTESTASPSAAASPAAPTSQSKKKKTSYKNMMASMMKQQNAERDVEKEKEALRKVTGGGAFSKIDKI